MSPVPRPAWSGEKGRFPRRTRSVPLHDVEVGWGKPGWRWPRLERWERSYLTIFVFHKPTNCKTAKERHKISRGFLLAVGLLPCDRLEYICDAFRVVIRESVGTGKFPDGYQVL